MSVEMPKNFQVILVFAVIISGGSSIFNYSQTGVTTDKIDALEEADKRHDTAIAELTSKDSEHGALFAHAGIKSLVDQQGLQINNNRENNQWIERCLFAGECFE